MIGGQYYRLSSPALRQYRNHIYPVDWNTGILTVKKSKHGQAHRVPMNSIVQSVISEAYQNRKSDRIFPNDDSQML